MFGVQAKIESLLFTQNEADRGVFERLKEFEIRNISAEKIK
jgi:hypothetical protein